MNTKQNIVAGGLAFLIAGCCTYDSSNGKPQELQIKENVEFVGYQPTDEAAFIGFLKKHNTPTYNPIFRVQEYREGVPVVGDGHVFGGLEKIECELQSKIDYWIKNPLPGKTVNGGATKYGGQLGLSCSTSCVGKDRILSSREMADDFRSKFGLPLHSEARHHHGH